VLFDGQFKTMYSIIKYQMSINIYKSRKEGTNVFIKVKHICNVRNIHMIYIRIYISRYIYIYIYIYKIIYIYNLS